jgi:hypothetical protein
MKELLFSIIIFLFLNPLVLAQVNMTPGSKEEAENIAKDFLLDIPITNEMATELAKNLTNSNKEPEQSNLIVYQNKGKSVLAWNFSFDDKEVLIDATNGKIINVKIKKLTPLGVVSHPIFITINVIVLSFIIVYLFKILMDKYFKKKEIPIFYEEEQI